MRTADGKTNKYIKTYEGATLAEVNKENNKKQYVENENKGETEEIDTELDKNDITLSKEDVTQEEKIDGSKNIETIKEVEDVKNAIQKMYDSNAYIEMHVGDKDSDIVYLLYNEDKECCMGSGFNNSIAVFRNDNKAVVLTDPVEIVEDIHLLALLERVADMVYDSNAKLTTQILNESTETKMYTITVTGKHNIRKIYEKVSESYADNMLVSIFGAGYDVIKYKAGYIDSTDKDKYTVNIVVDKNGNIGASCELNIQNKKFKAWWFDGYIKLKPYKLSKQWYKENTVDEWEELVLKLQKDLYNNMVTYENGN